MTTATFRIDPALRDLCPPLSPDEYGGLRDALLRDGCRDALVVAVVGGDRILADGHNRHALCQKHGLPYDVAEYEFADLTAVRNWIIENALARRNLSEQERRYLRGKRLDEEKVSGFRGNQHTASPQSEGEQTAERIAKSEGVSRATVERDAAFARNVDKIAETVPEAKPAILSGEVRVTRDDVAAVAKATPETMDQIRDIVTQRKREPTPKEQAKAAADRDPEVRWAGFGASLMKMMNSVRDAGGIQALAATWTPAGRARYARHLGDLIERLTRWKQHLEESA